MSDLEPLLAQMRMVAGAGVNDLQLQILVTLVTAYMGRKGGRPPRNESQIDVTKPVTQTAQTGLANVNGGVGGASVLSLSGSGPEPDPSKQIRRRYNTMSAPQGFHDFWALYPRRVAKQAAIKAWQRQIGVDVKLTLLALAAIEWQAVNVFAGKEEDKIPHAATWLNGKRWEDERPKTGSWSPPPATSPLAAYCEWHRQAVNAGRPSKYPKPACPDCKHIAAKGNGRASSGPSTLGALDEPLPDWAERTR